MNLPELGSNTGGVSLCWCVEESKPDVHYSQWENGDKLRQDRNWQLKLDNNFWVDWRRDSELDLKI